MKKEEIDGERYLSVLGKAKTLEDDFEINVPLISFAEDLATLFFTEIRNTKVTQTFDNLSARFFYKSLSENMMDYEVTKKEKVKMGVYLIQLLIRNLTFDSDADTKHPIKKKILKIVKKNIDSVKIQNFICVDKEFVMKYYVSIYFIINDPRMICKKLFLSIFR